MDLKFLQKPGTSNEKWMITLVNDSTDEADDRALKTVCLSMKKSIKNKLIGAKKKQQISGAWHQGRQE